MKNRTGKCKLLCVFILFVTLHCSIVKAQQTLTTINGWNAYVHLPDDYTTTTTQYPVIIFISGVGEVGTNPSKMLVYGPSHYIAAGETMNFMVNGNLEKPIVISIQPPTAWPIANSVNTQIDSITKRWRINKDRIYLTGLSMGGWSFNNYITASQTFANKPAAIVTMSTPESNYPLANYAWYATAGGKWWGFEGTTDYRKMDQIHQLLNATVANSSRYTQYVGGHCCWNTWYNPNWKDTDGESIYTWMLKQTKSLTSPANILPVANAGIDQNITLPANSITLSGTGVDADGSITSYSWNKISGPSQFTINTPGSASTQVTNLTAGQYAFELTVTDNLGAIGKDVIYVIVNAPLPAASACNTNAPVVYTLTKTGNEIYIPNASTRGWKGGDTLRIPAGNYDLIDLGNFKGDSCRPIVIINYGGQVVSKLIRLGNNASYFKFTGSGHPGFTYGIKVQGTATGVGIVTAHHVEISNVEVTGTQVGFYFKRNPVATDLLSIYPNYVMSDYYIHHNYIHDVHGEGMYIGHTYPSADPYSGNLIPIRMDKVEIAYNIVDGTDWDGIQLSNARSGAKIHHNTVTNFGRINMGSQQAGIILGGNTTGDVYDNMVSNGTGNGIEIFGYGTIKIYNNTVENAGGDGTANGQESVYCNDHINQVETNPVQQIQFYNNIVKFPRPKGAIRVGAYNNNSAPAQLTNNQYCIPSAPSNWLNTYVVANPGGSVIANNILMTNCGAANQPPVANAGSDINITLPVSSVTLNGTGTDADGTITAYQWIRIAGPTQFAIVNGNSASTAVNNLVAGTYKFVLTVTDNGGLSAKDTIQVTVSPAVVINQPPVANAGANISITLPLNQVTVNGSGTDPDGTIASYLWNQISGPAPSTIASASAASTIINNLASGQYQFVLTVTDNGGLTAKDTTVITVNPAPPPPVNQPPVANAGADISITLPLNAITLNGSGLDPDGTIVSFQWNKISGPTQFTISTAGAASTAVNNLVQGVYQFELTVTDNGGLIAKDIISITVNAAPPPPPPPPVNQAPVANAGSDITITLPVNTNFLSGSGSDADGIIASYQWNKISGPATFTIVNAGAASTSINNLVQGVYEFELTVTDNGGLTGKDTVRVTVNAAPPPPPVNQPPVVNAGSDITITLPTNSISVIGSGNDMDGTITSYQWNKIAGPSQFVITNAGLASTSINNLVQGQYQFELVVTDNGGLKARDTIAVIVNAAPPPPPNQAPVANAGNNITITLPANSVTLNGSGTDGDGTISSYQWTKISGPSQFVIVNAGASSTEINSLVQGQYSFELRITDNGGLTGKDTVTITVNAAPPPPPPPANQPPVVNAGNNLTVTLPTNSVTLNGSAIDADGTIASYQWTKIAGPSQFVIVNPSVASTVINNLVQGQYSFEFTVTDNGGLSGKDTVTVTVNAAPPPPPPVNKAPVANAGADVTITLPLNSITIVGKGTDDDGTVSSYQWAKIAGPGQFAILNPITATTFISGLAEGQYKFELTVTDNGGLKGKDTVNVTVQNADAVTRHGFLDLIVYPNPATNSIKARMAFDRPGDAFVIGIFNAIGERVYVSNILTTSLAGLEQTIDIASFKAGTYFMTLLFENGTRIQQKFIKQ